MRDESYLNDAFVWAWRERQQDAPTAALVREAIGQAASLRDALHDPAYRHLDAGTRSLVLVDVLKALERSIES